MQVEKAISRRYFDFQSRITGPVFNRIFSTPGNAFAERFGFDTRYGRLR